MFEQKSDKGEPVPQLPEAASIPAPVTNRMEEIMRRLRLIEERYSGIRKKSQLVEQNMLKDSRDIYQEIKALNDRISELKGEISELNERFAKFSEEIKGSVSRAEFNVLSKYMDFWEPINFLTREQAEKIIEEVNKKQ